MYIKLYFYFKIVLVNGHHQSALDIKITISKGVRQKCAPKITYVIERYNVYMHREFHNIFIK